MSPTHRALLISRPLATAAALALVGALASPSQASAAQAAAPPSDAEIAHIVVTANQVDIDAGELAKSRTSSKEVKEFAQRMVIDHTAANRSAADLAKKLSLTPKDNPTSQSLAQGGEANRAALSKLTGAAFDRAYVDHEVTYHQQVLDAIDQVLLPNAKNPELKALITSVRPVIASHLQHAKLVQTQLAGGAPANVPH
jgi:putative membrane protein